MGSISCVDTTFKADNIPDELNTFVRPLAFAEDDHVVTSEEYDLAVVSNKDYEEMSDLYSVSEYIKIYSTRREQYPQFIIKLSLNILDKKLKSLNKMLTGQFSFKINYNNGHIFLEKKSSNEDELFNQIISEYSLTEICSWFGLESCDSNEALRILTTLTVNDGGDLQVKPYRMSDQILTMTVEEFLGHFTADKTDELNGLYAKHPFGEKMLGYRLSQDLPISIIHQDGTIEQGDLLSQGGQGQFMVINFWATWCSPCVAERPFLDELARKYEGRAALVNISIDDPKASLKLKTFIQMYPIAGVEAWDPNKSLLNALRVNSYPSMMILNPNHEIIWAQSGALSKQKLEKITQVYFKD